MLAMYSGQIGSFSSQDLLKRIPTPHYLVTSTLLTTTYESFFGLHPISQVFDQTNPLTQIVHGRKFNYLGPGGLTGRTASFRIRDIHPSNYRRICPIKEILFHPFLSRFHLHYE